MGGIVSFIVGVDSTEYVGSAGGGTEAGFVRASGTTNAGGGGPKDVTSIETNGICLVSSNDSAAGRKSLVSIKYNGTPTEGRQVLAAIACLPTPRSGGNGGMIIYNPGPLRPWVERSVPPSAEAVEQARAARKDKRKRE